MATVIDPLGTPSVVFADPATNVQDIDTLGTDGSFGAATAMILPSQDSILVVTVTEDPPHSIGSIKMPQDADSSIGSLVEIHCESAPGSLHVYDNVGNLILQLVQDDAAVIRKTASNTWRVLTYFT